MPATALVDGVKIMFYANEHPPSHFHAVVAEYRAVIDIATATVTSGLLPVARERKVLDWAASRQDKLLQAFLTAAAHEPVEPIE